MDHVDYVLEPYTLIVDTREQHGYSFTGYTADATKWIRKGDLVIKPPLVIPLKTAGLRSGDYSIEGYENIIAVERKSKQDAYQTFCHGRDRFERELERLNALPGWAGVVIEASLAACLADLHLYTKYSKKSFYRQWTSWEIDFRGVHWIFNDTRNAAERKTFRLLQKYWLHDQRRLKQLQKDVNNHATR